MSSSVATETQYTVSIVIEWYNVTRAKESRTRPFLTAVSSQVNDLFLTRRTVAPGLCAPLEIVITYNSDRFESGQVERAVCQHINSTEFLELKFVPVPGATYLKQKNVGAAFSKGDIILFLDSDLIPEPGWLAAMLKSFMRSDICVAVGNTYVDLRGDDVYSKALAISWMFPLRDTAGGIHKTDIFYSNNVGFRRGTFLSRQFADVPKMMHVGAKRLVDGLESDGIPLWYVGDARASHPAPNGLRHFIKRAIAGGRARALSAGSVSVTAVIKWVRVDFWTNCHVCKRILTHRAQVGLRSWQTLEAMGIATAYNAISCTGSLLCFFLPKFMQNRFDL